MGITKSKPDQFTPLAQVRPDLEFVLHVLRGESTGTIQRAEPKHHRVWKPGCLKVSKWALAI